LGVAQAVEFVVVEAVQVAAEEAVGVAAGIAALVAVQQRANPSTVNQAGLLLSVVELEEVLGLIAVFAFLQGQHMKELEDWSCLHTASTEEH
jgi:hypothetical protein